ncbi:hypothetical protein BC835DRAFT_873896 [Cytidiella melzeri]|nr:hypothetical protein BC835DRAFT_873896 [Cytidiella melzeri]
MSPGPSRHGEGEQDSSYPVPDITVESPSTDNSRPSSVGTGTATVPHLLSPEHAHTALPALAEMFGFPSPLDQQPSRPHSTQSQGREWSQQTTPLHYAEAPVPPNVVYPEVPRTKSRAENRSLSSSDGESGYENSFKSVAKRQQQVQQRDSLSTGGGSGAGAGGRLSPLSLFK